MSLKTKYSFYRKVALVMCFLTLFQTIAPTMAYALTSGPSQPEVQAFEPFGTSEMVDLFSGDFTYNIPLFELPGPNGGYPFNLAYHSGVGMDQEATWVGLGWSLNPGAINRNMRGLPDDFNGDKVRKELDMKENKTVGGSVGFGIEITGFPLGFTGNITVSNNSYKGLGMSMSNGVNFSVAMGDNMTGGIGLNVTLDNQEGASVTPSLSLGYKSGSDESFVRGGIGTNASFNFNSRRGLTDVGFGVNTALYTNNVLAQDDGADIKSNTLASMNSSASISFANSTYSPTIGTPMKGYNTSISTSIGGDAGTVYMNGSLSGFFSKQYLKYPDQSIPAFGYLNMEKAKDISNDESIRPIIDVNREKDGVVRYEIPNLAIPSLTYDFYSIQGQGVGGMFRPYRNDIGVLFDQYNKSEFTGGGIGGEVGLGYPMHFGLSLDINHSEQVQMKWVDSDVKDKFDFTSSQTGSLYENVYWKRPGEQSAEKQSRFIDMVGGDKAINLKFPSGDNSVENEKWFTKNSADIDGTFIDKNRNVVPVNDMNQNFELDRRKKTMPILSLKNSELDALGEFSSIKYFSTSQINDYTSEYLSPTIGIDRNSRTTSSGKNYDINHHIGGISVLNANGARYVYGLPAINVEQKDVAFTVDGRGLNCGPIVDIVSGNGGKPNYKPNGINTDEFYSRETTPAYAHSYMLTSILGTDYVDLTNNGPTNDDMGYWVKFNYLKTDGNYKWRAPYNGANHIEAFKSMESDDKGTFIYGEKEIWYLATAETKTHVAVFDVSERSDGKGAVGELASLNSGVGTNSSYKLDNVKLYSKIEFENSSTSDPIQIINFDYDYSLCPNVINNDGLAASNYNNEEVNTAKGKLTLKKVWIEYGTSNKGKLNPYIFDYGDLSYPNNNNNPQYSTHAYDRWGNFKPIYASGACDNLDFPYTEQYSDKTIDFSIQESVTDEYAGAWNLKKILMPSGGELNIDYESDDYAYVQDKTAMQMFNVVKLGKDQSITPDNWLYDNTNHDHGDTGGEDRKIYFELLEPTIDINDLKQYLDYRENGKAYVYYKTLMTLRIGEDGTHFDEYMTGYAEVIDYGFDILSSNLAWVQLASSDHKSVNYHPFTFSALQYMKGNLPNLAYNSDLTEHSLDESTGAAQAMKDMFKTIGELFTDFYKNRTKKKKSFCQEIDLDHTWIRLNSVTKTKKGGGCRVKKLSIIDNWADLSNTVNTANENSEYGQIYEYKTTENGKIISSGVATYEPILGGDENALRYHKEYSEKITWRGENSYLMEFPINESYYPAASVGYSKVTVKSLNTNKLIEVGNPSLSDEYGFSSSGVTINEFYTAKDYPIISDETSLTGGNKHQAHRYNFYVFGSTVIDKYAGSQGYYLELNDMHGKQEKVSNYALDKNGQMESTPYSSVQYNYFDKEIVNTDGTLNYKQLINDIPVIISDVDPDNIEKALIETADVGIDYEMFTDMRKSSSNAKNGGLALNVELFFVPWPLPLGFPMVNVGSNKTETYTAVTNKIVHRTGILKEIVAINDGATISTQNLYFDELTGQPLLTKVDNDYENSIYNYSMPARWKYADMGAAYTRIGLEIEANIIQNDFVKLVAKGNESAYFISDYLTYGNGVKHLKTGDELLCTSNNKKATVYSKAGNGAIIVFEGNDDDTFYGYFDQYDTSTDTLLVTAEDDPDAINKLQKFILIRPAERNLLAATTANIVSLADPTEGREWQTCSDTIYINTPTGDSVFVETNCTKVFTSYNYPCIEYYVDLINETIKNKDTLGQTAYYNFNTSIPIPEMDNANNGLLTNNCLTDMALNNINFSSSKFENGAFIYNSVNASTANSIRNFGYLDPANMWFNTSIDRSLIGPNFNYLDIDSIKISNEPESLLSQDEIENCNYSNIEKNTWADVYTTESGISKLYKVQLNTILYKLGPSSSYGHGTITSNFANQTFDVYEPVYTIDTIILTDQIYSMDSILQASVTTFSDSWDYDYSQISSPSITYCQTDSEIKIKDIEALTDYANGRSGIWRAKESYVYHTERKGILHNVSNNNDPHLEDDGIFDMVMFDWKGSSFANKCAPSWVKVNEITRFNVAGFGIESKDALNNYSSALYGYESTLPVAMGQNTKYEEFAFESFEESVAGNQYQTSTGNIDIYTQYIDEICGSEETFYDISSDFVVQGCQLGNGPDPSGVDKFNNVTLLSPPNFSLIDNSKPAKFNIESVKLNHSPFHTCSFVFYFPIGIGIYTPVNQDFYSTISNYSSLPNISLNTEIEVTTVGPIYGPVSNFYANISSVGSDIDAREAIGTVYFPRTVFQIPDTVTTNYPSISFINNDAHTGKKALQIDAGNSVIFDQRKLKLDPSKEYLFSAWVKEPTTTNIDGYINDYLDVLNENDIAIDNISTKGMIINGWQKIEGEFIGSELIKLRLKAPTGIDVLFDDIRIQPVNSGMETYVYDPQNYKLRATLDNNNFATLYYYNAEGNLYLVKKETAKGIRTIQESRSHLKENN